MAYVTAGLLATSTGLVAAGPAQAAPDDVSEALGKFLGGQTLSIDLDDIAEINGAFAENPSGENPVITNPLAAEVLNTLTVDLGDGFQLFGSNGIIELGAVNQYGEAQSNGDARAASGAVSDQGAISVGASDEFPSNATIELSALLPTVTEDLIDDLSLELGALSSSIEQLDGGEPVSDYQIAGATLNLESPAIGGIYTELLDTVDGIQDALDGLSDTLSDGLDAGIDLGGLATLGTSIDFTPPDLSALLPSDVVGESSGVTVDLTDGAVTVDLQTLLAADDGLPDLNAMTANSELLSGPVVAAIADGITQAVTDVVTVIVSNIQDTIAATSLGLVANVQLLFGTAGITVTLDANLAELLDGEAGEVVNVQTSGLVDLLEPLLNFLGLTSPDGLGDLVFNTVGGLLGDTLDVLTDLEDVVDGITAPLANEIVGPLLEIVNEVVALTVNAQPQALETPAPGDLGEDSSTVRALQVSLVPAAGPLAQVNLASSTVRGTAVEFETSISADPSEVEQGESTLITGEGFASGETVEVSIPDAEVVETTADEDGDISVSLPVPADYELGETDVTAVGEVSDTPATTPITVIEPDDEDPVLDPSVTVTPGAVDPGEDITVDGSGYTPDSTVTVVITDEDEEVVATIEDVPTDSEGGFEIEWTVPEGTEPGDLTVTATDDTEPEFSDSDTVTVNEPDDEDPVFETSISADPSEVEQGESTLITGEGFASGETVEVSIPDAEVVETTADEDGDISVSLPVPADYELGETDVTAVGEVSDTPATTPITVIEPDDEDPVLDPSVTVTPDQALPDDEVTISGEGYTPDSTVTIVITDEAGDEVAILEDVETDSEGDFVEEWIVPEASGPGELTVTATDDTDPEASDSDTLVVLPVDDDDEDADEDADAAADPDAAADEDEDADVDATADVDADAAVDPDADVDADAAVDPDADVDATADVDADAAVDADANVDASASASASADADASADPAAQAAAQEAATADADTTASASASASADVSADPAAQAAAEVAADEDASSEASADADSASEAASQAAAHSDSDSDASASASAEADANAAAAAEAAANEDASSDASATAAADAAADPDAEADVDADAAVDADANVDASASASASADADASADPAAQAAAQEAATADADTTASADASASADVSADPAAQAAAQEAATADADTTASADASASADADSASEAASQAAAHSDSDSDASASASAEADANAAAAAEAAANEDASSDASATAAADAAADPDAEADVDATADEDADAAADPDAAVDADADAAADGEAPAEDPSVTVEPDTAEPGDEVTITGEDFVPGSTVTVEVTDADGNVIGSIEGVEVDADGQFEVSWAVPEDTEAGELTVTATDDSDSDISASATLTITDGAAPDEDDDGKDLAATGVGGVGLLVGLSVLLLMAGATGLMIVRSRASSTE